MLKLLTVLLLLSCTDVNPQDHLFDCYYGGYGTRNACQKAGCTWYEDKGVCVDNICFGDFNGDGKVKSKERSIVIMEYGRADCLDDVPFSWDANKEEDLAGYMVYKNNECVADVGNQTWYTLMNVTHGEAAVSAYDIGGLESELSESVEF